MKMTTEQQDLATQNLKLVDEVIYFRVRRVVGNPDYDYDELHQIGSIGLCLAARSYHGTGSFTAFAREAIWHEFLMYFKRLKRSIRTTSLDAPDLLGVPVGEHLTDSLDVENETDTHINFEELQKIGQRYTGVAQKGVQAMTLKLDGLTNVDIAELYHVKSNHVSAWISRAQAKLAKDHEFLALIS